MEDVEFMDIRYDKVLKVFEIEYTVLPDSPVRRYIKVKLEDVKQLVEMYALILDR